MYKTSFPFEHCWNELRFEAKWLQDYETKKKPKSKKIVTPTISFPSIPDSINLAKDNASPNNFVDLERPLGKKGEKDRQKKRKSRECGNESFGEGSPVLGILKEFKEEKIKLHEKNLEFFERSYILEKEKMQMKQLKGDEKIMLIDTNGMSPVQAEYFQSRQMEILQRRQMEILQQSN